MEHQASTSARHRAKALRTSMTDTERRLWSRLRFEQLGVKLRRQPPLGTYVLDLVCLDRKRVVESHGSQHLDQQAYDERRTVWLAGKGYGILRFWANEILSETHAVVDSIVQRLATLPPLAPTPTLPQRGRESISGVSSS
jgi:very-short-patch-repair endonuclease